MTYDSNNIFAKILRGEIPVQKIYEDASALSFYDIKPKAKVHVLVISKQMVVDYSDFVEHSSADEIAGFNRAVLKTVKKLKLDETGYRIVFNAGPHSGQEVPHLHAHILGGEQLKTSL
ncbi:MAG: HIT domain-containing protein [Lactobacillales bacterium]|jgi:diadenosine tetraphosphate (Ap4A) HIT family hydrolase|nr:HIT domain-containing protein [Lactobacillales bacterium]